MTTLEKALEYMGIKKLPKEGKSDFTGDAIALVTKFDGMKVYVIARWNPLFSRHEVKKDFYPTGGTVKDFEAFYPIKGREEPKQKFEDLSVTEMMDFLNERNIPFTSKNKVGLIKAYQLYKKVNR